VLSKLEAERKRERKRRKREGLIERKKVGKRSSQ